MDRCTLALLLLPRHYICGSEEASFPGFYQHCLSPHSMEANKRGFR